ncbi:MAG: MBL fold metallo-hydrolase [Candidatus Heimdallarchaeota archaeon]|nr:MBL fold metallo-hydrolase [Candidatus Heimdallarchaeota archaeon]MDH5644972.1 MBL fold metallo-hydrolase [Candidatus Heimdallarchaeota archaeon]
MIKINFYGVRGSIPQSGTEYIQFGGATSSITIRTPMNTLLFLDAGTGIITAQQELNTIAEDVYLFISHTHADHIQGLGMTKLPWLSSLENYKDKNVHLVGPKGIGNHLQKYYDGDVIWPVSFLPQEGPYMFGFDKEKITEYEEDNQEIQIDRVTTVRLLKGIHPVSSGVILYKFIFTFKDRKYSIIYATDNEFDYIGKKIINPNKEEWINRYIEFIYKSDILIADAQYSNDDYTNYSGFGHSYHNQIIDIACQAKIKHLYITHHHNYDDRQLKEFEDRAITYSKTKNSNLEVSFAKIGLEKILQI